ncbi:MAG: hypothetical protein JWQ00_1145 [Noviherbaspirillum sp.]|jgi:hypothetical protein|nr:hypothetical protein [Noviherbaspirillum sp.]
MDKPQTPYEQASYDLNKFRERRMSERRATPRGTADRRGSPSETGAMQNAQKRESDPNQESA